MHKFYALITVACLLAGCSQFTTSKQEQGALAATAAAQGDAYVDCVTRNALSYTGQNSGEIGTVMTVASAACQSALASYTAAQDAYLQTQVMLTDKALDDSIAALNDRAKEDIAQQLVNRPASAGAAAAAASATVVPAATPAPAAPVPVSTVTGTQPATQVAAPAAAGWTPEQRIYLDCMTEQGRKYSGVNESATVVADVAQSRCRNYLREGNAALEQEGLALVMGEILDAKLDKPAR